MRGEAVAALVPMAIADKHPHSGAYDAVDERFHGRTFRIELLGRLQNGKPQLLLEVFPFILLEPLTLTQLACFEPDELPCVVGNDERLGFLATHNSLLGRRLSTTDIAA